MDEAVGLKLRDPGFKSLSAWNFVQLNKWRDGGSLGEIQTITFWTTQQTLRNVTSKTFGVQRSVNSFLLVRLLQ